MRRKGSRFSRPVIGGWYAVHDERRVSPLIVVLSVGAHVLVVSALIDASGPTFLEGVESDFRPVFYLPPPDRPISEAGATERIQYVAPGGDGTGTGLAQTPDTDGDPSRLAVADHGSAGELTTTEESGAREDEEPVYTVVEVHEEAVRMANSAAPAYPAALLAEGIEGGVIVRYVVEADGIPDVSSFRVVSTTRREFADAVRAALPYMRFTPARIDTRPVRQLVEQPFTFRIQRPADSTRANDASNVP